MEYQPKDRNKKILDRAMAAYGVGTKLIRKKIQEGEKVTKEYRKLIKEALKK